jgi:hypothetical protein
VKLSVYKYGNYIVTTKITLLSCCGSITTGNSEQQQGLLLQPKHIKLMGHVIFARTIVLVGGIQTEVCNLAAVQACKSLNLRKQVKTKSCVSPHIAARNILSTYCQVWLNVLHLMSKSGILVPSFHELSPHLMKLDSSGKQTIRKIKTCREQIQQSCN